MPAGWCLVELFQGLRFLHTCRFLFPLSSFKWRGATWGISLWLWPSGGREHVHVKLPTAPRIEVLCQHVQHFNITMNFWMKEKRDYLLYLCSSPLWYLHRIYILLHCFSDVLINLRWKILEACVSFAKFLPSQIKNIQYNKTVSK